MQQQRVEQVRPALVPAANAAVAHDQRMTAIFVANRADKSLDDKLAALEDFVSSRVTEKGFSLISHEVVSDAWSSFQRENPRTAIDEALGNQSSALRLAQMLNADYLLLASISSFGSTSKKTTISGKDVSSATYTLRVTYKLVDGVQGGTLAADTISVSETIWETVGPETIDSDLVNRLLDEAAVKVADSLSKKEIREHLAKPGQVNFTVACGIADVGGQPISVPDIRLTEDGKVVIGRSPIELQAVAVTVELDGAAIGSAPAKFSASPGLHKIRLTHEQCKPWERTINISQGQNLKVVLQMTDESYQRWKDQTAFLQTLENGRKLTDAEAEKIKGLAKFLGNSRYVIDIQGRPSRVDIRGDLKPIFDLENLAKIFGR